MAKPSDFSYILEENRDNVEFLSPMDEDRLLKLAEMSDVILIAEVENRPAGFLIAFREGTEYDSENYKWFEKNYERFLYVDRIVVNEKFRKCGIGKKLYNQIFEEAMKAGICYVTAEVDLVPYNGQSLKFHSTMGFKEVGEQTVRNGTVKVSLQEATVKQTNSQ